MKEIGSEFWDIPVCDKKNSLFESNTKWFLSGRHALEYIIIDSGIKSISMPRWCCESMVYPFRKHNIHIDYYDNEPDYSFDAILIMDYFGFVKEDFKRPPHFEGIIIRDLTHSLLSKQYKDADYYFGSLRKWAGFYTGGYAWGGWRKMLPIPSFDEEYVRLRKNAMMLKKKHIESGEGDKSYLRIYKEANDMLNGLDICAAYPSDIEKAIRLDIDYIKSRRRKNAQLLINNLGLEVELAKDECPLFVPIFLKNRDRLRGYLIGQSVYCPVHWPHYDVNGTELSLVCDQRYDEKDMMRMVGLISKFRE